MTSLLHLKKVLYDEAFHIFKKYIEKIFDQSICKLNQSTTCKDIEFAFDGTRDTCIFSSNSNESSIPYFGAKCDHTDEIFYSEKVNISIDRHLRVICYQL